MPEGHPNWGGPRPNSGGARPGSGRKPKNVEEYQAQYRDIIRNCVTPQDWETITMSTMARAKAGDPQARAWLSAWCVGAMPKDRDETVHTGAIEILIRRVDSKQTDELEEAQVEALPAPTVRVLDE